MQGSQDSWLVCPLLSFAILDSWLGRLWHGGGAEEESERLEAPCGDQGHC